MFKTLTLLLPTYMFYLPYITSYLALVPATYAYTCGLYDITISCSLICITSIGNHSNFSNHNFWRYSDLVLVHLTLSYYFIISYLYLPLWPYKTVMMSGILTMLFMFYSITSKHAKYFDVMSDHANKLHSIVHIIGYMSGCIGVYGLQHTEYMKNFEIPFLTI